ncbi:hypothetical protein [Klebsiella pneumoniae]
MGEISVKTGNNARNGGKNSLNRLIRCVCGKKIGPDPRNFNQRVSLGRNDLLIRTFPNRGKNYVFDTKAAYDNAFHESKAQHILLAYTISKAIEKVKLNFKAKINKISSDEDSLLFLQNLKSRFFLISVIGEILDELTGKPLDKKFVKFNYNSSLQKNLSLDDLINIWVPVITAILPYVIRQTGQDLTAFLTNTENPLQHVAVEVKSLINTVKGFQPIPALDTLSNYIE